MNDASHYPSPDPLEGAMFVFEDGDGGEGGGGGGEGGGGGPPDPAPHWGAVAGLAPAVADHPLVKTSASPESFASQAIEAQKLIGRKGVIPPGENPTPEEVVRYYGELGRPETAAAYEIENIDAPDGFAWDNDHRDKLIGEMHRHGLTTEQARGIAGAYMELEAGRAKGTMETTHENHEKEVTALKGEWGLAYDANVQKASAGFRYIFGEATNGAITNLKLSDGRLLGDHPDFVKGLYKIGALVGEPDNMGGDPKEGGGGVLAPEAAAREIEKLENDPKFTKAYYDRDHEEHKQAVERMKNLYDQRYPEGTPA